MSIPVSTPATSFSRPQVLNSDSSSPPAAAKNNSAAAKAAAATIDPKVKDKSFGFWDLVDIINPLQHIPIVNSIYRHVTGDEIGSVARVAGGALYGGVVGAAFGAANAVAAYETDGKDISDIALTKVGIIKPDGELASSGKDGQVHFPSAIPSPSAPAGLPMVEVRPLASVETKNDSVELANIETSSGSALAMPSAKDLNDIAPGSAPLQEDKPASATNELVMDVPKPDVQQNMLQALAKYEAMQRKSVQNSSAPAISNPTQNVADNIVKNAGIIPVNLQTNVPNNMPVPIPGHVEQRKANAAYSKFRHF